MRSLLPALTSTAAAASAALVLAAPTASGDPARAVASATATLNVHTSTEGKVLVTSSGATVYLWEKDQRGARVSACEGSCQATWHFVLVKGKPLAGSGVQQKMLGTIPVKGGEELTYNGWPLYTYAADKKPGATNGEGKSSFGATWWMISPSGLAVQKGSYVSHPHY